MEQFNELKELGLDDHEIQVYLACLSHGCLNVKNIAKKTGIIRTTVYGIADALVKKGIMSETITGKEKVFRAVPPREFLNILEGKKAKIEGIINDLEKIGKTIPLFHKVEFFEGRNGVKTITNDLLSAPNQVVKVVGAGKRWITFSESFATVYYRKKKEQQVKTETILSDTPEERRFIKRSVVSNSEFRFLPGIDVTHVATFIYQNKVSFVSYDENPRGYIITDKQFHDVQNMIFDHLWQDAKK
jgi:sugar-specific transcriptional regulator TrmB